MRYLVAAALLAAACKSKDEVQVYRVAKPAETAGPAAAPAGQELPPGHPPVGGGMPAGMGQLPPGMAEAASGGPSSLAWKAPKGWQEKPASGMRRATFVVPGAAGDAELSVVSLPGDAGGTLANVNRWRGQVGLSEWDEAAMEKGAARVASPAGAFTLVDLPGGGQRMLGAILSRAGETWFFKLVGPDKTVAGSRSAFRAFLSGVKPAA